MKILGIGVDIIKNERISKLIKNNKFKIYDLRNLYNPKDMKLNNIEYFSIGRQNSN